MRHTVSRIEFHNSTDLSDERLLALCEEAVEVWAVGTIRVRVRYSRGADFSGTCFYADRRIHVNLGRHLAYPYAMGTHLARARRMGACWTKSIYTVGLADGYQVVLFVFLHELFHLLVKRARRNTRQKESMCDRFAARFLVDRYGASVRAPDGESVPRPLWDFQDVEGFVAGARGGRSAPRVVARRPAGPVRSVDGQSERWLLFPI